MRSASREGKPLHYSPTSIVWGTLTQWFFQFLEDAMKITWTVFALASFLTMSVMANAQGVVGGAQQGASTGVREGNKVAGPVGGAVGGVVGGTVGGVAGGVKGALGIPSKPKKKKHVE
jgi:hypothetical protein